MSRREIALNSNRGNVAPVGRLSDGPTTKHAQMRSILGTLADELGPDGALPSERELMTSYQVSRATVRDAIRQLEGEGRVTRIQGKGTFVARPRVESRLHLASFTQDMKRRGSLPSTRLIEVEQTVPPAEVARSLQLGSDAQAWHVVRLRRADGVPIALEDGWYAATAAPDLGSHDLEGSLYTLFATQYGLVIDHAEQTVWAETTGKARARLLEVPADTAVIVFRRQSSAGSIPIEYVVSRYLGDRYQIHMSLDGKDSPVNERPPIPMLEDPS